MFKNRWQLEQIQREEAQQPRDFHCKQAFQRASLWATTRKAHYHVLAPIFLPMPRRSKSTGVKRKQRKSKWICNFCARAWSGVTSTNRVARCGRHKAGKNILKKKLAAWMLWRPTCPEATSSFVHAIWASKREVDGLEREASKTLKLKKALPPLQKCRCYRNLTGDGDVEPNPGPGLATSKDVHVYFHNTNGLDNAYQSVREAIRDRPHIIGLVEVGAKQSQRPALIADLQRRGYRSWYFGKDDHTNSRGITYTRSPSRRSVLARLSPTCLTVKWPYIWGRRSSATTSCCISTSRASCTRWTGGSSSLRPTFASLSMFLPNWSKPLASTMTLRLFLKETVMRNGHAFAARLAMRFS